MATEQELAIYRSAARDPKISPYQLMLSPHTAAVLNRLLDTVYFIGGTDSSALSVLALYVRVQSPRKVLELGTFGGMSTMVMADILSTNHNPGSILTVDLDPKHVEDARAVIAEAGLLPFVSFLQGDSTDPELVAAVAEKGPFDMIYIDTSHARDATLQELDIYLCNPLLSGPETIFFFHDSGLAARLFDPTGRGGVHEALVRWLSSKGEGWQAFFFDQPFWPNPCGLGILSHRFGFSQ